jgi:hypothetical protein
MAIAPEGEAPKGDGDEEDQKKCKMEGVFGLNSRVGSLLL